MRVFTLGWCSCIVRLHDARPIRGHVNEPSNAEGQIQSRTARVITELLRNSQMLYHDGEGNAYRKGIRDVMTALGFEHPEGVGWVRRPGPE